jgi:hypothetical protein
VTRKSACVRRGAPSRRRTRFSSSFSATHAALQVSRRDPDPRYTHQVRVRSRAGSVAEPDPQDPNAFGSPGSG